MGRVEVLSIMAGSSADKVVRGEIWVAPIVLESQGLSNNVAGIAELAARLRADICFLSCNGPQRVPNQPEALGKAAAQIHARDLACGTVVDGPWQRLVQRHGLLPLLEALSSNAREVQQEVATQTALTLDELKAWAEAGADLALLSDDLAFSTGLYFSPTLFAHLLLFHYQQILLTSAEIRMPLGFHSDGNLMQLLPMLVEAGFSFFSLEPEAVDLAEVQRCYSDRITLVSGIRADWLNQDRLARLANVDLSAEISSLARTGRLILASACGLFDPTSLTALRRVYDAADGVP